jgi:biopolymer transport protein ExbB
MIEMFLKGGPIMWPLLILSVCTAAVAVDRLIFVIRIRRQSDHIRLDTILDDIASGDTAKATQHAEQLTGPVGRVLAEGCRHSDYAFEEAVSVAAERELDHFEEGISLLDASITMAPLLGLLGTVTGMIKSFGILGASQLEAPVAITGGIAEALIATAFGLMIAIIALVPLSFIRREKEKFRRTIEDMATKVEIQLRARRPKPIISQIPKSTNRLIAA